MTTPNTIWQDLQAGNERFINDQMQHPAQNAQRRGELTESQSPKAIILSCSDSRVPPEILFDQGLGDLFVVRTAGQVVDDASLGSLEYAVGVLKTPLIVVLGHASCGALAAALNAYQTGSMPPGHIHDVVTRILPGIIKAHHDGHSSIEDLLSAHVSTTIDYLTTQSNIISSAINSDSLGIVGAVYDLAKGQASGVHSVGSVTH